MLRSLNIVSGNLSQTATAPPQKSSVNRLSVDEIQEIVSYLGEGALRNVRLSSHGMNRIVKVNAELSCRLFVRTVISRLHHEKDLTQKRELEALLSKDLHFFTGLENSDTNLQRLIRCLEEELRKVLDGLDTNALRDLVNNIKPPEFFEGFFMLVRSQIETRSIDQIPEDERSLALCGISQDLAMIGKFKKALEVAQIIPVSPQKVGSLQKIVIGLILADKVERALEVIPFIEIAPLIQVASSKENLRIEWALLKDVSQEDAERCIEYMKIRVVALETIALALIQKGQLTSALDVARLIAVPQSVSVTNTSVFNLYIVHMRNRFLAIENIFKALIQKNEYEATAFMELVNRGLLARSFSESPYFLSEGRRYRWFEEGVYKRSLQALDPLSAQSCSLEAAKKVAQSSWSPQKVPLLQNIALTLIKEGNFGEVREVAQLISSAALDRNYEHQRDLAFGIISRELRMCGDREGAMSLAQEISNRVAKIIAVQSAI